MKKILVFLISCFVPFVCSAAHYIYEDSIAGLGLTYKVTPDVKSAWGNPTINRTFVQDSSTDFGDFRIKQGWACCGNTTSSSVNVTVEDDQAIMAWIAHDITPNGAEFCLTQLAATSGPNFDLNHQQPRWPGLQCAWFCKPGYDGIGCMEKSNPESACNTTDYNQRINAVKASLYSGNDAISQHHDRMGVAEYTAVLDSARIANVYWHEIVVGAVKFMEHGIVARPILIGVVGDHKAVTLLSTSGVATGKTQVLCAQGFTADDNCNVSSKNCGKTLWCTGYSEDVYKSKAAELEKVVNGYCTAYVCTGDKALSDDLKSCVDCKVDARTGRCDVLGNSLFGKCKRCAVGQFFNSTTCECDTARAISKDKMQYGKNRTDVVTNQCWVKEDAKSYKECVLEGLE